MRTISPVLNACSAIFLLHHFAHTAPTPHIPPRNQSLYGEKCSESSRDQKPHYLSSSNLPRFSEARKHIDLPIPQDSEQFLLLELEQVQRPSPVAGLAYRQRVGEN